MKRDRATWFIVALISFVLGQPVAAEEALPALKDPIFKLTLKPSLYADKLQAFGEDQMARCGLLVRKDAAYRDWVMASSQEADGRYAIVAGVSRWKGGSAAGPWENDPKGAFLREREDGCVLIDPGDQVFDDPSGYAKDPSFPIEASVFDHLAADAVRRFSAAFGSRAAFAGALRAQHRYPSSPALAAAIAAAPPR